MQMRKDYTCPLELTHDMIRGKWKPIIIWRLRLGPTSLSALTRDIHGITQKMLLQHLRELAQYAIVDKTVYGDYPLKTDYFLTKRGEMLLEALAILQKVGIEYMLAHGKEDFLREKNLI